MIFRNVLFSNFEINKIVNTTNLSRASFRICKIKIRTFYFYELSFMNSAKFIFFPQSHNITKNPFDIELEVTSCLNSCKVKGRKFLFSSYVWLCYTCHHKSDCGGWQTDCVDFIAHEDSLIIHRTIWFTRNILIFDVSTLFE